VLIYFSENVTDLIMPIEKSDTKLFHETKQDAEKFPEIELNFQTPLSPAHACNLNTILLQDDKQPLTSPSLIHGNHEDPINDLHILKNSEQTSMKLFQDFLSFLDKRTQHKTASPNKERDENILPRPIQTTDIHPNPTPHASPSNQNTQGKIMHKLTTIQQQIERMQQTKNDQKQQQLQKKTETRTCFRCGKIGHVANFCRSKPLIQYKTAYQTQNSAQRHRRQTLFPPRHRTQAHLLKTRTDLLQRLLNNQAFHQELNQNNGIFCRRHSYGKQTLTSLLLHRIRYDL